MAHPTVGVMRPLSRELCGEEVNPLDGRRLAEQLRSTCCESFRDGTRKVLFPAGLGREDVEDQEARRIDPGGEPCGRFGLGLHELQRALEEYRDLVAATKAGHAAQFSVALVEQPYRVAGRRSSPPAHQLDAVHLLTGEERLLQNLNERIRDVWS